MTSNSFSTFFSFLLDETDLPFVGGDGSDRIFGSNGNDVIDGGAGEDRLFGRGGNDTVSGGADDDRLFGGNGDDVLVGNTGDDTVRGGNGNDLLIWNNGDGSDLLDGNTGFDTVQVNFNTNLADDDLANDDVAEISDSRQGINFARVELNGQTEAGLFELDIRRAELLEVNGGAGNDTLRVVENIFAEIALDLDGGTDTADATPATGAASLATGDTIDLSGLDTGVRVDLDENNQGVLQPENDLSNSTQQGLSEFGNVQIAGEVVIDDLNDFENAIGTEFDDTIFGNTQNNVLLGGAGNDTLHPFGGDDFIDGGDGTDLLLFSGFANGQQVDIAEGTAQNIDGSGTLNIFVNIENINGSSVAGDVILGGAGANALNGQGGDDFLNGRAGDDTLIGGAGVDTLDGGIGNDTFVFNGDTLAQGTEDTIEDFTFADDRFGIAASDFEIAGDLAFVNALAEDLPNEGVNVVVLQNSDDDNNPDTVFNARSAAGLIAEQIHTDGAGLFVYFNSGLGVNRLVSSSNLNDADADLNILARLDNFQGQDAIAALENFSAENFAFLG